MMKRIATMTLLAGFLVFSGWARAGNDDVNPDRIREVFATSGDERLQLAADALGDDGLVKLFDELKISTSTLNEKLVKRILKPSR